MANISTIKVNDTSYGIAPASHASTATIYGAASDSNYGHVKLSDNYTSSAGAAASGIGASSLAVYNAYNTLNSSLSNKTSYYGTCATNRLTPIKEVDTDSDFTLVIGATIRVKMVYDNAVTTPRLNVNGTGDKSIRFTEDSNVDGFIFWRAGSIVEFVYDGDYWFITNWYRTATTSYDGLMSSIDKTKLDVLKLIEFVSVDLGSHTFSANSGSDTITVDVSNYIPSGYTLAFATLTSTGNDSLYFYWIGMSDGTNVAYKCRNISSSSITANQYCRIICVKK